MYYKYNAYMCSSQTIKMQILVMASCRQITRHYTSRCWSNSMTPYGPLTRYVKLRVAHAPGMPRTFLPTPNSKETASWRSRHASRHVRDARAVMHVGIANPRWLGKRSRHSRRMRNPQYIFGNRPMAWPGLNVLIKQRSSLYPLYCHWIHYNLSVRQL